MVNKNKDIYIKLAFLLFIFSFYFAWAIILPLNGGPDEIMRYQIPKFIYENGYLPHGGDPAIRQTNWGISYAFTPILSYMISALFMKFASFFKNDNYTLLVSARLVSVLCSVGTAFVCIQISKKVFNGIYRWIFVILISLLPQFIFISTYVNNDAFAIFSTSIIVYSWILGIETNWNYKSCTILAIGISLCLLSYYNAYGFILVSVLIFTISNLFKNGERINFGSFLKKGLYISLIVFILSGWWFIRNYIIYDGDFIGLKTSNSYSEKYAIDSLKPSNRLTIKAMEVPIFDVLFKRGWLKTSYKSFIGMFGLMSIPLYNWMYSFYSVIFIVGLIGILLIIKRYVNLKNKVVTIKIEFIFNLCMALACIIPVILSFYYSYNNDYQPQGRYCLPMIVPLMYFITMGIGTVFERFFNKNSKIYAYLISFIYIIIAIVSYTHIIVPYYYYLN